MWRLPKCSENDGHSWLAGLERHQHLVARLRDKRRAGVRQDPCPDLLVPGHLRDSKLHASATFGVAHVCHNSSVDTGEIVHRVERGIRLFGETRAYGTRRLGSVDALTPTSQHNLLGARTLTASSPDSSTRAKGERLFLSSSFWGQSESAVPR
jgi:hypothetical protein